MADKSMKIGIVGGTFDPIHSGHLAMAEAGKKELKLDRILFIPTGVSYMKEGVSPNSVRYEMVRLALQNYPGFEISDIECKREGNTYTCDTLRELKQLYPEAELYFIIGTDTLYMIEKWKNVEYLLKNLVLAVCKRKDSNPGTEEEKAGELRAKYGARIIFISFSPVDISSTEIREYYRNRTLDNKCHDAVPALVNQYILKNNVYRADHNMKRDKILKKLEIELKPKRYVHTLGVEETAVKLAGIYGVDEEKASIAALLHDCAKHLSAEDKIAICEKNGVEVSELERANPELLHAKAGSFYARDKYGIEDEEVLSAIFYHTTGREDMSMLEEIIFDSDFFEPNRTHSDKLPGLRKLAESDLHKATAIILKETLSHLKDKKSEICGESEVAYEFYKKYL